MIVVAVRIGEEADRISGLAFQDPLAFHQLALEPLVVLLVIESDVAPLGEKGMGVRVAFNVHTRLCHFSDLLPGQRVRRLPDDLRINEYRERKMALLQLGEGLGEGAAPAVVDRDRDRILRQRGALSRRELVDVSERNDRVIGHRQIAHLLPECLARDLHARILRRLDDVVAEHRRAEVGISRGGVRSDAGNQDGNECCRQRPRGHGCSRMSKGPTMFPRHLQWWCRSDVIVARLVGCWVARLLGC